jgi:hypothetical protein
VTVSHKAKRWGIEGNAVVQVQRSVRPHSSGGYSDSTPTVLPPDYSGPTLDICEGEQSIYEQYKLGTRVTSLHTPRACELTVCARRSRRQQRLLRLEEPSTLRTSTWPTLSCLISSSRRSSEGIVSRPSMMPYGLPLMTCRDIMPQGGGGVHGSGACHASRRGRVRSIHSVDGEQAER